MATLPPTVMDYLDTQPVRPFLRQSSAIPSAAFRPKLSEENSHLSFRRGKKQCKSPLKTGHTVCSENTAKASTSVSDTCELVGHQLQWPQWNNVAIFQPRWFFVHKYKKGNPHPPLFTTPWQNTPAKVDGVNFSAEDFNCWATLEVVLQITESWVAQS